MKTMMGRGGQWRFCSSPPDRLWQSTQTSEIRGGRGKCIDARNILEVRTTWH